VRPLIPTAVLSLALLPFVLGACSTAAPAGGAAVPPSAPATGQAATSPAATSTGTVAVQKPVPPETNPPGDIPDNQAFVAYQTPVATVKTPEGWSRRNGASSVMFTDKLNTIELTWTDAPAAPTVATVRSTDLPELKSSAAAFQPGTVTAVTLPAGPAVLTKYRENSAADPVTGKQYRLDVERYTVWRNGKRVDLTLLSPVGADNVDPWRIVSRSLTWR
jgi:hypothetical protein